MIAKKKVYLIFVLFVLLPIIVSIFNGYLAEERPLGWSYDHRIQVTTWSLWTILVGNAAILYFNYSGGQNSVLWYIVSSLLLIISAFLLHSLYLLSNFGF